MSFKDVRALCGNTSLKNANKVCSFVTLKFCMLGAAPFGVAFFRMAIVSISYLENAYWRIFAPICNACVLFSCESL